MIDGPLHDLSAGGQAAQGPVPAPLDRDVLGRLVRQLADRLRERGIRPGERVALVGANSAGFVAGLLALIEVQASIVLIDASVEDHRVAQRCGLAGVTRHVLSSVPRRLGELAVLVLPAADAAAQGPSRSDESDGASSCPTGPDDDTGAQWPGRAAAAPWWGLPDALVVFSSGTTGAPTAIVRSGPALLANLRRTQERMGYRTQDVLLPLLPFSHQYGLSLVLLWWLTGCSLLVLPPTALAAALRAVDTFGVTVVDATPSTYHSWLRVMARRRSEPVRLRSVRMWCVGGAPSGPALLDTFATIVGRPLLDGYGSSELGNVALATCDDPVGCGRPLSGLRIEVVGEHGEPLPPGAVGRIVVHSPDQLSAVRIGDDPWTDVAAAAFQTQDLGSLDDQGRLTVIGRAQAVHRLGHTLYPEALARRAEACGAPVAVIAVPEERAGCRLVFAVADPAGASAAHWRPRICAHLDAHEWPNLVLVLDRFPVNISGKVDPDELRRLAGSRLRPPGTDGPGADRQRTGRLLAHQRPERQEHPGSAPARPAQWQDRSAALTALAHHLEHRPAEVIARLTPVISHRCAQAEIAAGIGTLRGAGAEVEHYRPARVGRIAVFMPSNIPLYAYVLNLMVPALYAERVVFRPSGHIRDASVALHDHLAAVHGLCALGLNLQTQREFLAGPVADSEVVIFTGTYANAEKIRGQLRPDQLMIFFGQGINPVVIGADADIATAAEDVVKIRMINNGQDCFGPDVVFVHDSVADDFEARLRELLSDLRFGRYADPCADYGPLLYEQALGSAVDHLHRVADTIVHGGSVHLRDRHLEPTVLRRTLPAKLACDELFAPIFNLVTYGDEADLHQVLGSPFFAERAMGAMVYGVGADTVSLLAQRHHVCIDTTLLTDDDGNKPFGGRGIRANYTAIDGARRAEPLLISKAIADHLGTRSHGAQPVSA